MNSTELDIQLPVVKSIRSFYFELQHPKHALKFVSALAKFYEARYTVCGDIMQGRRKQLQSGQAGRGGVRCGVKRRANVSSAC